MHESSFVDALKVTSLQTSLTFSLLANGTRNIPSFKVVIGLASDLFTTEEAISITLASLMKHETRERTVTFARVADISNQKGKESVIQRTR